MTPVRLALAALLLTLAVLSPAGAENRTPYSGTVTVASGKPFLSYVGALETAIGGHGFNMVGLACATCAAESLGVKVPGNRVFLFFKPPYAVRMLEASTAAGIEAPIRLYVTERPDGTAEVTYRLPSHVFGAYQVPALDALGADLDRDVASILAAAAKN